MPSISDPPERRKPLRYGNGEGSVTKLSGKRRKPWLARISYYDDQGFRQRKTVGTYATKREARDALQTPEHLVISKDMTLAKVYEQWYAERAQKITESTARGYRISYTFLKSIHHRPLQDLRTAHYQQIIDSIDKSYSTVSKVKGLLLQLYKYAMVNDLVDKDYAEYITLPSKPEKKETIFTDAELQLMIEKVHVPWVDTILILCYTGLRIGELLEMPVFSVKDGCLYGGSKTSAGRNRAIPIHPKIAPLIDVRAGESKSGYLIEIDGKKASYKRYRARYKETLSMLGLVPRTIHATRHTFATLCAKSGLSEQATQQIIGHADYATTANIYTHLTDLNYLRDEMLKIK